MDYWSYHGYGNGQGHALPTGSWHGVHSVESETVGSSDEDADGDADADIADETLGPNTNGTRHYAESAADAEEVAAEGNVYANCSDDKYNSGSDDGDDRDEGDEEHEDAGVTIDVDGMDEQEYHVKEDAAALEAYPDASPDVIVTDAEGQKQQQQHHHSSNAASRLVNQPPEEPDLLALRPDVLSLPYNTLHCIAKELLPTFTRHELMLIVSFMENMLDSPKEMEHKVKHIQAKVPPKLPPMGGGVGKLKEKVNSKSLPQLQQKSKTNSDKKKSSSNNDSTTKVMTWEERFQELLEIKKKHGNVNIPSNYPPNPQLAKWVGGQRSRFRKKQLSRERYVKLSKIGFRWKRAVSFRISDDDRVNNGGIVKALYSDELWALRYSQLCEYRNQYGDCNVPKTYYENIQLAKWVQTQRVLRKRRHKSLTPDRISKLCQIEFDWGRRCAEDIAGMTFAEKWDFRLHQLILYRDEVGHCNVPKGYKKNKPLAGWLSQQRRIFRKGRLTEERRKKLTELGVEW